MRRIRLDAEPPKPLPAFHVQPTDRAAWRYWLERFHAECDGVSLVIFKKPAAPQGALTQGEAVAECLCFGWSGGIIANFDETRYVLRLTVRRAKSLWSGKYKALVASLEKEGLMTDAGRAAVARAKRDGSWTTLDEAESLEIPDDLKKAFSKNKKASENFGKLTDAQRKYYLYHITMAKRPETRAARIVETVECNARGRKNRLDR